MILWCSRGRGWRRVVAVPQSNTVQVAFPPAAGAPLPMIFTSDASTAPLTAQKDKTAITVRWLAHDDNGDELMFAVWYRGSGEANWRLLKDKISERFYSFDSALLPDGSLCVEGGGERCSGAYGCGCA